jgi:hypothetical protein
MHKEAKYFFLFLNGKIKIEKQKTFNENNIKKSKFFEKPS